MTITSNQWELGKVIAKSFYMMQGGEKDEEGPEPNSGDLQLAYDIMDSQWFKDIVNPPQCCCHWGAASAKKDSDEFPEFDCADCPIHRQGLGPTKHRCKRHRREHAYNSG